jgi:hypothetical protein
MMVRICGFHDVQFIYAKGSLKEQCHEICGFHYVAGAVAGVFFFLFFYVLYSSLLYLPPLRFQEDAGIKPRTVATSALAVRHSNH